MFYTNDLFSYLCIWGFPFDEEITVSMQSPDGKVYHARYQVQFDEVDRYGGVLLQRIDPPMDESSYVGSVIQNDNNDIVGIEINLWWSVIFPLGEWHVEAKSISAESDVTVEVISADPKIALSLVPTDGLSPFEKEWQSTALLGCQAESAYTSGMGFNVSGINFSADQIYTFAIYHENQEGLFNLAFNSLVEVDSNGRFMTNIKVEPTDPPGLYVVALIINPEQQILSENDLYSFLIGQFRPDAVGCFYVSN